MIVAYVLPTLRTRKSYSASPSCQLVRPLCGASGHAEGRDLLPGSSQVTCMECRHLRACGNHLQQRIAPPSRPLAVRRALVQPRVTPSPLQQQAPVHFSRRIQLVQVMGLVLPAFNCNLQTPSEPLAALAAVHAIACDVTAGVHAMACRPQHLVTRPAARLWTLPTGRPRSCLCAWVSAAASLHRPLSHRRPHFCAAAARPPQ